MAEKDTLHPNMLSDLPEQTAPPDNSEQSTGLDEVLPIVMMKLDIRDVKKYYAAEGANVLPAMQDILIHVRKRYPNPRQRVIIQCDVSLPAKDLADSMIYVAGVNADEADVLQGIGYFCYCPIEITPDRMKQEGYGIQMYVEEFRHKNNITNCELLFYGDNTDDILEVWRFIQSSGYLNYTILFPQNVVNKLQLLPDGLDIAPYAKLMSQAMDRNALDVPFIKKILADIGTQVEAGKVRLQDFEETRSVFAKWITLTVTQQYNLVPVYLGSYISEYVDMEAAYPLSKLSMYERFKFVERLPSSVGYVGKYRGFSCIFAIIKKIYPIPAVAFDVKNHDVITEGLEDFTYDSLRIADWREWFKGSPTYYVTSEQGKATTLQTNVNDSAIDEQLRKIFLDMTAAAGGKIYMSVRNSVLAMRNGKTYILYYDQPLGLAGAMVSEHFGSETMVLSEEHFNQLIDVRLIVSINKSQDASTEAEKHSKFTQLMTTLPQTFNTAIPLDVLMNCVLVGQGAKELSYYDRRLRCDKNVLPIITHADSESHSQHTLFDHLDVLTVGEDPVAGPIISSFGSINSDSGYFNQVPVSIKSFKGWKLL